MSEDQEKKGAGIFKRLLIIVFIIIVAVITAGIIVIVHAILLTIHYIIEAWKRKSKAIIIKIF